MPSYKKRKLAFVLPVVALAVISSWRCGNGHTSDQPSTSPTAKTETHTAALGSDDVGLAYDLVLDHDSSVDVLLDWDPPTVDLRFRIVRVWEVVVVGERTGPATATTTEKLAAGSYQINVVRYGDAPVSYRLTVTRE